VDFYNLVPSLVNKSFFGDFSPSLEQEKDLEALVNRWKGYIQSGQFSLSVNQGWKIGQPCELADFWTAPSPYVVMKEEAPVLVEELKRSDLVIFKV